MSSNTFNIFFFNFREVASNNETMATILLQNLLIQLDEQLGRVSKEKNLLLIHNLKRIRKVLQVRRHSTLKKKKWITSLKFGREFEYVPLNYFQSIFKGNFFCFFII